MNKELAIECIKTQMQFVDDMTKDAFRMAVKALEGNSSESPNNWIQYTPETMPDREGFYEVTMDGAICGLEGQYIVTCCGFYNGKWDENCVIAYKPVPLDKRTPYQPKEKKSPSCNDDYCEIVFEEDES